MQTSNLNENVGTGGTQLQPARRSPSRVRTLWRELAHRLRYLHPTFAKEYVLWLEQLSEEKYADLAGALLANGFIHLGYPRQARARLLVETRFGIAAELEQLPVVRLIQKLTESSIDMPSSGETIKATFLRLRADTERAFNKAVSIESRVSFVRDLIDNEPEQFAAALARYRHKLESLLLDPYTPYRGSPSASAGSTSTSATALAGRGGDGDSARTARRCAFSPDAQAGPHREALSRSARPAQVSMLALTGPFVNTRARAVPDGDADTEVVDHSTTSASTATPSRPLDGMDLLDDGSFQGAINLNQLHNMLSTNLVRMDERLGEISRRLVNHETGVEGAIDNIRERVAALTPRIEVNPRLTCAPATTSEPCCITSAMPSSAASAGGAASSADYFALPAASPPPPSMCSSCQATASPNDVVGALRELLSLPQPVAAPPARPAEDEPEFVTPTWLRASRVDGLDSTACKKPDMARVQAQRPAASCDSEQLKAARRQLSAEYTRAGLLQKAPKPGETNRFVLVRHAILEGWAIYRYIVSAVPEASRDAQLLAALIECAAERASSSSATDEEQYRWRTLEKAETIDEFVDLFDQMYADSADNLVEDQWAAAQQDKKLTPIQLYYRLVPLLVDTASIKRGKALLLSRLALDPNNRAAMSQLRECNDNEAGLHAWRKVFSRMEADVVLLNSEAAKLKGVTFGATPQRGLNAFGDRADGTAPQDAHFHSEMNVNLEMSQIEASKTILAIVQERAVKQGLPPPLHLGDPVVPALMQAGMAAQQPSLAQQQQARGAPEGALTSQQLADAIQQLTALVAAQGQSPSSSGEHLAPFGSGRQRPPKPIFDLPKIYDFLGIPRSQLPPAKPGCSAAGGVCKICVRHGIKSWPDYKSGATLQPDQQFDHNSWKCPYVEEEVRKAAVDKGTPASEVADLLVPLESPPWRGQ